MLINREFGFDMGHMLPDHLGGCYRLHGHRYRLDVCLDDDLATSGAERGMVMDFARLKQVVEREVIDRFDHRFAVCRSDPRAQGLLDTLSEDDGLIFTEQPPTAENLVTIIAGLLADTGLPIMTLRLWETPTCSAMWVRPS